MSTPLAMPRKPATLTATPLAVNLVTETIPTEPAKIVRPGLVEQTVEVEHDGIVKAKHLVVGQTVRAYLHGKACGGERVISSVERIEDGAFVQVEFSSPHPTTVYKAAYRFFIEDLVGAPVTTVAKVPALVTYEEV